MNKTCLSLAFAAVSAVAATSVLAEDPAVPVPHAASIVQGDAPADLLGAPFENESAGISLRIPAGCHRVRASGTGDDLGQFADDKRNWQMKLSRSIRPAPTALASTTDNFGKPVLGLLDQTIERLKHDMSGCKILRSDLTNVQDGDPKLKENVAMIAVRYSAAGRHYLTQQAIIQSTPRLFYLLSLTTPGSEVTTEVADNDPVERSAVETFRQMLDSVRLLDTAKIAQEQVDRLFRTRALMVNWTPARVRAAIVDKQWIRIIRDGKDVGYSFVTEQTASGVPRPLTLAEVKSGMSDNAMIRPGDGLLIGVRARSIDPKLEVDPGLKARGTVQVDSASWMFASADRRLEDWSRVIVVDAGTVDKDGKPVKSQTEEFGSSNKRTVRAFDKDGEVGTKLDPKQPPVSVREQYSLDVTTVSQSGQGDPVSQDLPPWYLPQALGHLLPRLLPLHVEIGSDGLERPRSYLFAMYVPETRAVMHRYVDVKKVQDVTFAGNTVRAVPIEDRIGWHGSITTHYMTPSGVYLGSENKESHLVLLASDEKTLLSIWKNADLSRPGGVERPHGAAQGLPTESSAGSPFGAQPSPER